MKSKFMSLVLLTGGLAFSSPAGQSEAIFWCASPYLCVTQDPNWSGLVDQWQTDKTTWWPSPVYNNDGTWGNGGTQNVRVYDYWSSTAGYVFQTKCVIPATTVNGGANQNKGSANRWTASTPC